MSLVDEEDEIDAAAQPQPQMVANESDARLEASTDEDQKEAVNDHVEENGV